MILHRLKSFTAAIQFWFKVILFSHSNSFCCSSVWNKWSQKWWDVALVMAEAVQMPAVAGSLQNEIVLKKHHTCPYLQHFKLLKTITSWQLVIFLSITMHQCLIVVTAHLYSSSWNCHTICSSGPVDLHRKLTWVLWYPCSGRSGCVFYILSSIWVAFLTEQMMGWNYLEGYAFSYYITKTFQILNQESPTISG